MFEAGPKFVDEGWVGGVVSAWNDHHVLYVNRETPALTAV